MGIFLALWRRWFGGWYPFGESTDTKWYHSRWFQYTVLCLVSGSVLFLTGHIWWQIIGALIILCVLFWGKGHGAFFDLGHHGQPDEAMLERYKKAWGYSLACKIFPAAQWYKYWFDTFLMFIRYEIPSLALIPFTGWLIAFGGVGVTLAYMLGWYLQDKGCKFLGDKFKGLCSSATNFAEIVGGFITGLLIVGGLP